MNRLLALDGGGIRGILTLGILERVEEVLRESHGNGRPDFVLADYFDFIGGTSTGAIIAAMLAWGCPVEEVKRRYVEMGPDVFAALPWWRAWRHKFGSAGIEGFLREFFVEEDGGVSTLGTARLRTRFLVVLRNGSTGSVWPLTNHPGHIFNRREEPAGVSNLDFPLWELIRASTAAPTFFPSQMIRVHDRRGEAHEFEFIDGGVSPYNNPSMLMYLLATQPEYGMNLPDGEENLFLVSVGTGLLRPTYPPGTLCRINRIGGALRALRGLATAASEEQDLLCRMIGRCVAGSEINREVGAVIRQPSESPRPPAFRYCRYNHEFREDEIDAARRLTGARSPLSLDSVASTAWLAEVGRRSASEQVHAWHFP